MINELNTSHVHARQSVLPVCVCVTVMSFCFYAISMQTPARKTVIGEQQNSTTRGADSNDSDIQKQLIAIEDYRSALGLGNGPQDATENIDRGILLDIWQRSPSLLQTYAAGPSSRSASEPSREALDRERAAQKVLEIAVTFLEQGNLDDFQYMLRYVHTNYPDTTSAEKADDFLEGIRKHD